MNYLHAYIEQALSAYNLGAIRQACEAIQRIAGNAPRFYALCRVGNTTEYNHAAIVASWARFGGE